MNSRLKTVGWVPNGVCLRRTNEKPDNEFSHKRRVSRPPLANSEPDRRGLVQKVGQESLTPAYCWQVSERPALLWRAVFLLAVVFTLAFATPACTATCDQAIVDKMMALYNLDTNFYEIEILSNRLKTDSVNADRIVIRPLTRKEPLGLFTVIVKVIEAGDVVESGQVRMKIKQFEDVVVLSDKIKSREPLSKDKLTIKRKEITSLYEKPLRSIEALNDYRAKRNLKKGTILTTAAIELTPDIESGREVSIVYVDGLCRITAVGVALQSGVAGDYVKVKNKGSGKIILARIVDGTAVAVDP